MRVLILSAILACACAAPSVPILAIAPIIPAAIPTLSPGDLQAAAIDAKVKADDEARALADQARLAADVARDQAELAVENQKAPEAAEIDAKVKNDDEARLLADQARLSADIAREQAERSLEFQKEKTEEVNSIAKEKSEELFWNVEDKKWQAIDAVKTVEAKLDGAVAGNAEALVKSLTIPVISPLTLPYANLVYAPGLIPLTGIKETLLKSGELEKAEKEKLEGPVLAQTPVLAQGLNLLGAPWPAPIALYQPGVIQPVLTPLVKQW